MAKRICAIADCGKPHEARGFCPMHYRKFKLYGDPEASAPRLLPTICTVEGCEQIYYGAGLCEAHYARRRRHGGLHDARAERTDPVPRFWRKVNVTPGCWQWTDGSNGSGYGSFNPGDGPIGAHVYALTLVGRVVPPGLEVDHLCSNRLCVRPDHLDIVTHAENLLRAHRRAAATA